MQMYTTVDIIEEVVCEREDIKLYGLSFGPKGAILGDEINRFTYVCDKLTYDVDEGAVNPLFLYSSWQREKMVPQSVICALQKTVCKINGWR